jgi:hypothetical protein
MSQFSVILDTGYVVGSVFQSLLDADVLLRDQVVQSLGPVLILQLYLLSAPLTI